MLLKEMSTWTYVPWYFCEKESGERLKLNKEEQDTIKSNEFVDCCTLIFLWKESYFSRLTFITVAFSYMQQTYFHLIMSLHLLSFPKHSETNMKSYSEFVSFPLISWVRCGTWLCRFLIFAPLLYLLLLKCWNRGNNYFPSDKRA